MTHLYFRQCLRRSTKFVSETAVAELPANRHHEPLMPTNPSRLPPAIEKLKAWRTRQGFSQAKAARILAAAGLPVAVTTLQQWEIGRHAPHAVTAAAVENFLDHQDRSSTARSHKTIAPVIERLKAWREANSLSQSEAVRVLIAARLPAKLRTLQDWETGRHSPHPITAAALERFLDQNPAITPPATNPNPPPRSA